MPLSTEINFAHANRYAAVNNIDIKKVYDKLSKEGKLPPLKESQLTKEHKAEDIAFQVLLKMEEGINSYEEFEDAREQAQKASFIYINNLIVINALMITSIHKQEMLRWAAKGIELAEKIFDAEYEKENKGYYWGLNETRPYIRMLISKMDFYQEEGNRKAAIEIGERLLYLNEKDNNGIRDVLQILYLIEKRYDDYIELTEKYPDDYSVCYHYNYALYLFLVEGGEHPDTKAAMKSAIDFNPFVMDFLKKKKIPSDKDIQHYNPQTEDGAILYFNESKELWLSVFGIQKWLKTF
jgi:hypothetical protein